MFIDSAIIRTPVTYKKTDV